VSCGGAGGSVYFCTEPRRRGVCPLRRVPGATATLGSFAVPRAARRCSPRLKPSPETLDWVPPVSPTAARRRPPPSAVARCRPTAYTHPAPSDQDLMRLIKPPHHLTPPPPLALGSRSDGSRTSQPRSNQPTLVILQKAPYTF
jgi:hypothetical protein